MNVVGRHSFGLVERSDAFRKPKVCGWCRIVRKIAISGLISKLCLARVSKRVVSAYGNRCLVWRVQSTRGGVCCRPPQKYKNGSFWVVKSRIFYVIVSQLPAIFCRFRASNTQNALSIMLSGLFSHDRPGATVGRSHCAITVMGVVTE